MSAYQGDARPVGHAPDALSVWHQAEEDFLTSVSTGRLALGVLAQIGADRLCLREDTVAQRIAFSALMRIVRDHPHLDRRIDGESADADTSEATHETASQGAVSEAVAAFRIIQDWASRRGVSAIATGPSRSATEALSRFEVASFCDRVSEQHDIGDRARVNCWFRDAHREAYRAVMMAPELLQGEDSLREEMLRVAAAAHLSRLAREHEAGLPVDREEMAGMPTVEAALQRASRLAVQQQRLANQSVRADAR